MDDYARFYRGLNEYYKRERDRSVRCLGDIIDLLDMNKPDAEKQIASVLQRLIEHYGRADEEPSPPRTEIKIVRPNLQVG